MRALGSSANSRSKIDGTIRNAVAQTATTTIHPQGRAVNTSIERDLDTTPPLSESTLDAATDECPNRPNTANGAASVTATSAEPENRTPGRWGNTIRMRSANRTRRNSNRRPSSATVSQRKRDPSLTGT